MPTTLPPNKFKRALAAGERQIGLWLSLASPAVAEIGAHAGFDWVLIDMEHAPNELPDVVHQLRATAGGGAEAVVRVPWNDAVTVKRLLDAGARSLLFPYVQSAEEARRAVAATRYPPAGIRGFAGGSRATSYGRVNDYVGTYAAEQCVIVQVESLQAVAAIPEIAKVDGIDGIFVGPADLAASMGRTGQMTAPECVQAVRDAIKRIAAAGKAPGVLMYREDEARELLRLGCVFIAVSGDTAILVRETDRIARLYKSKD